MANQDTDLRCYLTNAGIAAENNSIQLGRKLPVKEMVFGSGLLADGSDPRLQTTMIQEEYAVACGMLFDPENPTLLVFKGDLPADIGGFHIHEVAIRLEDGTLYGYARGKGDYKPTIEQGATDSVRYAVEMYTTNASIVECKIDLSKVYVDWEDLEARIKAHTDDNDPHPQYMRFGDEASYWASMPIGVPFPLVGDVPLGDNRFRYVVLTDADPYNDGVLVNKEVSGTAPNLVIKYAINMPDSPLNGQKIEMLNTMEAVVSPSATNGKVFNDTIRNITATVATVFNDPNGAFTTTVAGMGPDFGGTANFRGTLNFNASNVVPTGDRNQTFAIGAVYLMRIK
ncbi:TPA: phage tail protein [Vibrio cholerae]|nr:phage tail protein [Vibrio cholerae]